MSDCANVRLDLCSDGLSHILQIRIMRHLVVNDLLFRLMETDSMKMFSLYNRKEPLERLIKKAEGESSGIVFANVHCYSPRETHGVNEHANHEEIFVSFQGSGRLITGNEEREVFGGRHACLQT